MTDRFHLILFLLRLLKIINIVFYIFYKYIKIKSLFNYQCSIQFIEFVFYFKTNKFLKYLNKFNLNIRLFIFRG